LEFLVAIEFTVPPGTSELVVAKKRSEEAVRARELAEAGFLKRIWRLANEPEKWANVGLWSAKDEVDLHSALRSLPLYAWATISVSPLGMHPNDPDNVSPSEG